jgi:hypothetical protein
MASHLAKVAPIIQRRLWHTTLLKSLLIPPSEERAEYLRLQNSSHNNGLPEQLAKKLAASTIYKIRQQKPGEFPISNNASGTNLSSDFARQQRLHPGLIAGNMGFMIKR